MPTQSRALRSTHRSTCTSSPIHKSDSAGIKARNARSSRSATTPTTSTPTATPPAELPVPVGHSESLAKVFSEMMGGGVLESVSLEPDVVPPSASPSTASPSQSAPSVRDGDDDDSSDDEHQDSCSTKHCSSGDEAEPAVKKEPTAETQEDAPPVRSVRSEIRLKLQAKKERRERGEPEPWEMKDCMPEEVRRKRSILKRRLRELIQERKENGGLRRSSGRLGTKHSVAKCRKGRVSKPMPPLRQGVRASARLRKEPLKRYDYPTSESDSDSDFKVSRRSRTATGAPGTPSAAPSPAPKPEPEAEAVVVKTEPTDGVPTVAATTATSPAGLHASQSPNWLSASEVPTNLVPLSDSRELLEYVHVLPTTRQLVPCSTATTATADAGDAANNDNEDCDAPADDDGGHSVAESPRPVSAQPSLSLFNFETGTPREEMFSPTGFLRRNSSRQSLRRSSSRRSLLHAQARRASSLDLLKPLLHEVQKPTTASSPQPTPAASPLPACAQPSFSTVRPSLPTASSSAADLFQFQCPPSAPSVRRRSSRLSGLDLGPQLAARTPSSASLSLEPSAAAAASSSSCLLFSPPTISRRGSSSQVGAADSFREALMSPQLLRCASAEFSKFFEDALPVSM